MADKAATGFDSGLAPRSDIGPLGEPVDFNVRHLARVLSQSEAPEGWVKKIDRRRGGKLWIGYFHVWSTDARGRRWRQKKEKTLRTASMPKFEAQKKLAEYIKEFTGRVVKEGAGIIYAEFADLGTRW